MTAAYLQQDMQRYTSMLQAPKASTEIQELNVFKFKFLEAQMTWATERKCLETMAKIPSKNSSLKKKLAIVKRFKAISAEDFHQLLADIKSENLQKFYSEIVDSLLFPSRARAPEDIHRITAVLWLYSADPSFVSLLSSALKKLNCNTWVQAAIAAEVHRLFCNDLQPLLPALLQGLGPNTLPFINYLLESFNDLDVSIFEEHVRKELDVLSEKNITMLQNVCAKLGWEKRPEIPLNYKEVIKHDEKEFIFYTQPLKETSRPATMGDLRQLEARKADTDFLDGVGRSASDNPEFVQRILKKRKHKELVPAIARILMHLKKPRIELISKLLEMPTNTLSATDILMLCELCKFDSVRGSVLLARAEALLKEQEIERLCVLIEGAGRYLLIQRDSNEGMRSFLARLTAAALADTEMIQVNDALAKLYNISSPRLSPLDFFQWLFQARNFQQNGVFMRIASSQRLLALLFSQPHSFPSTDAVARLITMAGMQEHMLFLYTGCLEEVYKHSKQSAFLFVDVSALLMASSSPERQSNFIDKIFLKKLPKDAIHAMALSILALSRPEIHDRYLFAIKSQSPSTRTRTLLFNFYEKCGYGQDEHEIDSFEQEMEYMKDI